MIRISVLALAAVSGLAANGPAQAGGLLGLARDILSSNVSDPRNNEAVRAEQEYYDSRSREETPQDRAVQDEIDYYDSQSRAERDFYASQQE
jgi:hypothetical protein